MNRDPQKRCSAIRDILHQTVRDALIASANCQAMLDNSARDFFRKITWLKADISLVLTEADSYPTAVEIPFDGQQFDKLTSQTLNEVVELINAMPQASRRWWTPNWNPPSGVQRCLPATHCSTGNTAFHDGVFLQASQRTRSQWCWRSKALTRWCGEPPMFISCLVIVAKTAERLFLSRIVVRVEQSPCHKKTQSAYRCGQSMAAALQKLLLRDKHWLSNTARITLNRYPLTWSTARHCCNVLIGRSTRSGPFWAGSDHALPAAHRSYGIASVRLRQVLARTACHKDQRLNSFTNCSICYKKATVSPTYFSVEQQSALHIAEPSQLKDSYGLTFRHHSSLAAAEWACTHTTPYAILSHYCTTNKFMCQTVFIPHQIMIQWYENWHAANNMLQHKLRIQHQNKRTSLSNIIIIVQQNLALVAINNFRFITPPAPKSWFTPKKSWHIST